MTQNDAERVARRMIVNYGLNGARLRVNDYIDSATSLEADAYWTAVRVAMNNMDVSSLVISDDAWP